MKLECVMMYVADLPATLAFYKAAFDLDPSMLNEEAGYAQIDTGGIAIAFAVESAAAGQGLSVVLNRPDGPMAAIQLAMVSEDVNASFAKVEAAGGAILNPPTERPWGQHVGHVRDINGVLIEIASPQPEWG